MSVYKKINNELGLNAIIVLDKSTIKVPIDNDYLEGFLTIPENDIGGLVIFVHGSGSFGYTSRNEYLSGMLNDSGISTLLIDLLSIKEAEIDSKTKGFRFNLELLTKRLLTITDTMSQNEITKRCKFGYFGSSTGSAVGIKAAVQRPNRIITIVSRSGRLDLVDSESLVNITSSILLLVGDKDLHVVDISHKTMQKLNKGSLKKMILIPGATHLFDEVGKIQQVGRIASGWFKDKLSSSVK